MDETDRGLMPRIVDLKVNRKVNEINDLPNWSMSTILAGGSGE
jgi:hypothetical protein